MYKIFQMSADELDAIAVEIHNNPKLVSSLMKEFKRVYLTMQTNVVQIWLAMKKLKTGMISK